MIRFVLSVFMLLGPLPVVAEDVLLHEEFLSLERWQLVTFPRVPRQTRYMVEREDGGAFLRAVSEKSASLLVWRQEYDVRNWPGLSWRWRVQEPVMGSVPGSKGGDDYPLRIYVAFALAPGDLSLRQRVGLRLLRFVYGSDLPHRALNYVWVAEPVGKREVISPYTEHSVMLLMGGRPGRWQEQQVNVLEDYRRIFGHDPPERASLGIMGDADDTGTRAVADLDDLRVFR